MKKRLLITSIVMMLVVAVALSTATYAWFTSSTRVDAQAVTLTAATMGGEAILITHNADGSGASDHIELAETAKTLYPATPVAKTAFTTGLAAAYTAAASAASGQEAAAFATSFETQFQNLLNDGSGGYVVPTLTGTDASYYMDTFYVFNYGFQSTTLVPTVNITYDSSSNTATMAAKSARIAIIERVGTEVTLNTSIASNLGSYSIKGIWQFDTSANAAVYTQITDEQFSTSQTYYTRTNSGSEQVPNYVYTADATVDADNFADKVMSGLYIITGNKAVSGANGAYGATSDSGTYVNGNLTFQDTLTGDKDETEGEDIFDFSPIAAATSNHQVANEYTVIVWLEGWDLDCTNQITAGIFKVDLSFGTAARS